MNARAVLASGLKLTSGGDVRPPSGNFCKDCHSSWNCPPTGKEIKEGVTEGKMYCLDPRVVFELNGEKFPRLVDVAREIKTLCGPKGRYWQAVKLQQAPIEVRPQPVRVQISRQEPKVALQSTSRGAHPTRKPYRV